MSLGSTRLLSLSRIRAVSPAFAAWATALISSSSRSAHLERRHEQLPEPLGASEARHVVEDVGDVGGDVVVGREDPHVLVQARGGGVVVAGADVHVAPQPARLPPDDKRHLGVDLHVREAVDDVDARLLEPARPLDVPPLVEARLQLDEADGLLALLRASIRAEIRALSSDVR